MQTSSVLFLIFLLCSNNISSLSLKKRHLDPSGDSVQIKSITIDLIHPQYDTERLKEIYNQVEKLLVDARAQQERHNHMYIEKQKQCKVEQVQKQALVEADSAIIKAAEEARKECYVTQEELLKKKQEIEFKIQNLEEQIKAIQDAIENEDKVKELNINFGILIQKIMEFLKGEVKTMDVFLQFDWLNRAKDFINESREKGEAQESETIKIGGLNIKGDLKFKDGKLHGSLDWFRDQEKKEQTETVQPQQQFQFPQQTQQVTVQPQQQVVQQPIVQPQQQVIQQPIVQPQQPVFQQPIVQQPIVQPQQPIVQQPIVQQPIVQQPIVQPQQPIVQQPIVQPQQPIVQPPSEVPFEEIPEIKAIEDENQNLFNQLLNLLQTLAVDINLYKAGLIKYDVFQKKLYSLKTLFESAKDSLERQTTEIEEEILETMVCIEHQTQIIDQNAIHVENNQQLHNASVDHCINFEEDFKKQSETRAANVQTLGEVLAKIQERMDNLPERVLGKYRMTMEYFKNTKVPKIHINRYFK